MITQVDNQK